MSSTDCAVTTEAPLEFSLAPSARAMQWLFWLHVLPLAILLIFVPPGSPLVALALGVGASWLWLRRHPAFGHGPAALTRLVWRAEGGWTLCFANGKESRGELLGSSVIMEGLLLLSFREAGGGRCPRVLLGDELDAESLRRLRARLAQAA